MIMMNKKLQSGFTILELLLAMGLLGFIIIASGIVFKKAVASYRISRATSEITQKLEAITEQIEQDFSGLRKDGEIVIIWSAANPSDEDGDGDVDTYERLDRIMFFTSGGFFTSYHDQPYDQRLASPRVQAEGTVSISGNLARVTYMLARNSSNVEAENQEPAKRILARTQHILTSDSDLEELPLLPATSLIDDEEFYYHHRYNEYDSSYSTLSGWMNIDEVSKQYIIALALGIPPIKTTTPPNVASDLWGSFADNAEPSSVHKILSEGVGEFSIQGWYYDDIKGYGYRWFPEIDPDGDEDFSDSDFIVSGSVLDTTSHPAIWYPDWGHQMGPNPSINQYTGSLDKDHFNDIPGFGRALKFTFTLYDSMGVFEDGKTFTHIVYLD